MNTQVNWNRIRTELQRLSDVETLRSEVHRIGQELRKFDFHSVLSPSAKAKVKAFEKRYAELMRSLHRAQRQMDREVNRILRRIDSHRTDVSRSVGEQKEKLEKMTADFRKRFGSAKVKSKSTARPARRSRTSAARTKKTLKRRKA